MTWPLGYSKPHYAFVESETGELFVNDGRLTDPGGWMNVKLPVTATVRGAPAEVSVRLRITRDADGDSFLHAEQLEVGGRRHAGILAFALAEGPEWAPQLCRAIHDEIIRVARAADDATTQGPRLRPTRPMRAVAPPMGTAGT
jgi:hypothetical protein